MQDNNPFGEVVYSYSRRQALEDGVLVDLSELPISKQHWKIQIATTATVWNLIEDAIANDGKDRDGILHDLYCLAKAKIPTKTPTDRINFRGTVGKTTHNFILHCGPGDSPVPCLTLMLPSDD